MAKRILAYSDSKIFGGAEAVFCDVVAALRRNSRVEVLTAAPASNAQLAEGLHARGAAVSFDVPAQALTLAALDLHSPRRVRGVHRALAAADPDVLLVNLPSAEYGATPLRLRRPAQRRVGLLHVAGSPRALGFRLGGIRELLARRALASLDAACVLSESAAATFRREWDAGGAEIHRLPLPRPRVGRMPAAEGRRKLGLDADTRWIGIAGRITIKQKGHDTLVDAARHLTSNAGDPIGFAVAGEGRDLPELKRLVAGAGMEKRFRYLGIVSPIDTFLAAIDAIAIPSRFEGMPLIALEALAAGTPGVAAAVDGLGDLWPKQWLVPSGDPGALATSLAALLASSDHDRERIMRSAQRRMEEMTTTDPGEAVEAALRI